MIEQISSPEPEPIAVVDCTFIEKSGKHTPGLDWFYNGKTQRVQKGLEWSVIAIVDLEQQTGYALSAQQTEAGLHAQSTQETGKPQSKSRVDFYVGPLGYCQSYFPQWARYVAADGFYSKLKWVDGLVQLNLHAIGKLRCDADLRFLYDGPQKRRGCPRRYGDKVDLSDPQSV